MIQFMGKSVESKIRGSYSISMAVPHNIMLIIDIQIIINEFAEYLNQ